MAAELVGTGRSGIVSKAKEDLLAQAREAGVALDDAQLEWLDRMVSEHDAYFELWLPPSEGTTP